MSYTSLINGLNYFKLHGRACKTAINFMIDRGYKNHDCFTVIDNQDAINIYQIASGNVGISLRDNNNHCFTLNMSESSWNQLFTVEPDRQSARVNGVSFENYLINCLQNDLPFPGKQKLLNLVGSNVNNITTCGYTKIYRPLSIEDNVISIPLKIVKDCVINELPISIKGTLKNSSREVRLISSGLITRFGFCSNIANITNNNDINRAKLLKAIGIKPQQYNDYFGYRTVDIDQPNLVASLLEQAFGQCIYYHRLSNNSAIVKDYLNYRPQITMTTTDGIVSGFDKPANKHVQISYRVTIDAVPALATFMLRIDTGIYQKPNILQIKVKYSQDVDL